MMGLTVPYFEVKYTDDFNQRHVAYVQTNEEVAFFRKRFETIAFELIDF